MAKKKYRPEEEETSYWLSFSDMMAGLLLVFVLIITFTMMQSKMQYEEKTKQLEMQEALAKEQQALVEQQQQVLEQQEEKLDQIIGVRSELVEALKEEFDGTDLKVKVDPQTGAITFDSSVLFDVNKSDIKQAGEAFLAEFLPRYFSVLLDPQFSEYISEIIIEGHTDTNGSYLYNLELSQERALSVASFCLAEDNELVTNEEMQELRKIVTANGRSFSNPILDLSGNVDLDASRRVEFKFRLRDEEMVDEMMNILSSDE